MRVSVRVYIHIYIVKTWKESINLNLNQQHRAVEKNAEDQRSAWDFGWCHFPCYRKEKNRETLFYTQLCICNMKRKIDKDMQLLLHVNGSCRFSDPFSNRSSV